MGHLCISSDVSRKKRDTLLCSVCMEVLMAKGIQKKTTYYTHNTHVRFVSLLDSFIMYGSRLQIHTDKSPNAKPFAK